MYEYLEQYVTVINSKFGYTVIIFGEVFDMNTDCCQPNGVNMYVGDIDMNIDANATGIIKIKDKQGEIDMDIDTKDIVPLKNVPDQIKRGIVDRINQTYQLLRN